MSAIPHWTASTGCWPILRNHNPSAVAGWVKADGPRLLVEFAEPMRRDEALALFGRPGALMRETELKDGDVFVRHMELMHFAHCSAPAEPAAEARTALGNCQDALQVAISHIKALVAEDAGRADRAAASNWLDSIGGGSA